MHHANMVKVAAQSAPPSTMPAFSIILPTNKRPSDFRLSVISCLSSSFEDFELLIGIQDIKKWNEGDSRDKDFAKDSRVRLIDASMARNLPANLNILLRNLSCSFAVRHDDDDYMHPTRMNRLYDNLEAARSSVVIGQSYKTLGTSDSRVVSSRIDPSVRDSENREKLLVGPCFAHPAITLNMDKLLYGYDEEFDYAQDYKLYVDNFYAGMFTGMQSMATYYNLPNPSKSSYSKKRIRQLAYHDICMAKLWGQLLGSSSDINRAALGFRKLFLTSEDSDLAKSASGFSKDDMGKCLNIYHKVLAQMKEKCSRKAG